MRKRGPALFELIRNPSVGRKRSSSPPAIPVASPGHVQIPPKPRVTLATRGMTAGGSGGDAAGSGSAWPRESAPAPIPGPAPACPAARPAEDGGTGKCAWSIPRSTAALAGAGTLVAMLLIAVWAYRVGYSLGFRDGEERVLADRALMALPASDPLQAGHFPLNEAILPPGRSNPDPAGTARPEQPASPAVILQAGLNYCIAAARLDRASAERAAAFLTDHGIAAAAVLEVDGDWPNAKNTGTWRVVVLRGITREEYASRAPVRTQIEAALVRLGQQYQRDPAGRIDFGQFAWEKRLR